MIFEEYLGRGRSTCVFYATNIDDIRYSLYKNDLGHVQIAPLESAIKVTLKNALDFVFIRGEEYELSVDDDGEIISLESFPFTWVPSPESIKLLEKYGADISSEDEDDEEEYYSVTDSEILSKNSDDDEDKILKKIQEKQEQEEADEAKEAEEEESTKDIYYSAKYGLYS